jgi:uncharacterized protein (TIGR03000 family)
MFKRSLRNTAVLALAGAGLLLLPAVSEAQVRLGIGGGRFGISIGTPYYGYYGPGYGYGYGRSYGANPFTYGYGSHYGTGLYGRYGPYWSRSVWGYSPSLYAPYTYLNPYGRGFYSGYYSPSYYSTYGYSTYTPSYTYSTAPAYYSSATPVRTYQSFYPSTSGSAVSPAAYSGSDTRTLGNAVLVQVQVPQPDAQVWFGGTLTDQRGSVREYISPELTPGRDYVYEIRARWTENGQPVERTRTVYVKPGERTSVDFTRDEPGEPLKTPPAENKGSPPPNPDPNPDR